MARIVVPAAWQVLTGGKREFESAASTLGAALDELLVAHPALEPRLRDATGEVPSFTSVFVGEESVKALQGLQTPLEPKSVVMIVPAVVGG